MNGTTPEACVRAGERSDTRQHPYFEDHRVLIVRARAARSDEFFFCFGPLAVSHARAVDYSTGRSCGGLKINFEAHRALVFFRVSPPASKPAYWLRGTSAPPPQC